MRTKSQRARSARGPVLEIVCNVAKALENCEGEMPLGSRESASDERRRAARVFVAGGLLDSEDAPALGCIGLADIFGAADQGNLK